MRVKMGDVLVCQCEDCKTELTVTRTCSEDQCSHESEECEIEAMCCGERMELKTNK